MKGDERWHEIKEILGEALEVPSEERPAFLEKRIGNDETLRQLVVSYLEEEKIAQGFIEQAAFSLREPEEGEITVGRSVGLYRLVRQLGHGGMGTVFLAEREDGEVEHRVAIKVLKRGLDSDEIIRRFRTERQILARFEHPSIARFLDAGTTEDGLPYFVMEYVQGEALDVWCEKRDPPLRKRVILFRQILSAVSFAHANLVVHRDLKPENILVAEDGTPKLLDFGIAKLLYEGSQPNCTLAGWSPSPMTPNYASPEQLWGRVITTASDVYSLGVVLYQLLSGERPYRFEGMGREEVARLVCETLPKPPSATVVPAARAHALRGDLDNVVLKALAKEPAERFASAEQMSEDLRRYLEGLPVRSRPAGFFYRAEKFVRRNALTVSLLSLIFLLTMGLVASLVAQQSRILHAKFLTEFLDTISKGPPPAGYTSRMIEDIERNFGSTSEIREEIFYTAGLVYKRFGHHEDAETLLKKALGLRRVRYGEDHLKVAEALLNWADLEVDFGRRHEAAAQMVVGLEILRRTQSSEQRDLSLAHGLHNQAILLRQLGFLDQSEAAAQEALGYKRKIFGEGHPKNAGTLSVLGTIQREKGNLNEAERLYRQAIELYRGSEENLRLSKVQNNLAGLLAERGDLQGARKLYENSLETRRQDPRATHADLVIGLANLGRLLVRIGNAEAARALLKEALGLEAEGAGGLRESRATARIKRSLAKAEAHLGNPAACRQLAEEARSFFRREQEEDLLAESAAIFASCDVSRAASPH